MKAERNCDRRLTKLRCGPRRIAIPYFKVQRGVQSLGEQLAGGNVQRVCYLIDNRNRWVPRASFEIADIGSMDPGFVRKCFLTKALLNAQATQVFGKALTDIHVALETRLSPIDIQTMRDILVDCRRLLGMTHFSDRQQILCRYFRTVDLDIGKSNGATVE